MMLVLVLALCLWVTLCDSCSCPPFRSRDQYCGYAVIVRGTTWAEYEERQAPYDPKDILSVMSPHNDYVYSIMVTEAIKLPDDLKGKKMITIRTRKADSLCGTRFSLDADGVFFGYKDSEGVIRTGICDPNTAWAVLAPEDRNYLRYELLDFCRNPIGPPGIRPTSGPGSKPQPPGYKPIGDLVPPEK